MSTHLSHSNIWYHGSPKDLTELRRDVERENRGTNVAGIYLIQNEPVAREYAARHGGSGFVYEAEPHTTLPFIEHITPLTPVMMEAYVQLLVANTTYKERWARDVLVYEALRDGRLKQDLDGDIKRQVYQAAGHDSYLFNDMGDQVLVVFEPEDLTLLNKFIPQVSVRDPAYLPPSVDPVFTAVASEVLLSYTDVLTADQLARQLSKALKKMHIEISPDQQDAIQAVLGKEVCRGREMVETLIAVNEAFAQTQPVSPPRCGDASFPPVQDHFDLTRPSHNR
jgi:hypothetical protein